MTEIKPPVRKASLPRAPSIRAQKAAVPARLSGGSPVYPETLPAPLDAKPAAKNAHAEALAKPGERAQEWQREAIEVGQRDRSKPRAEDSGVEYPPALVGGEALATRMADVERKRKSEAWRRPDQNGYQADTFAFTKPDGTKQIAIGNKKDYQGFDPNTRRLLFDEQGDVVVTPSIAKLVGKTLEFTCPAPETEALYVRDPQDPNTHYDFGHTSTMPRAPGMPRQMEAVVDAGHIHLEPHPDKPDRAVVKWWDNNSGHFTPSPGMAYLTPLPLQRFRAHHVAASITKNAGLHQSIAAEYLSSVVEPKVRRHVFNALFAEKAAAAPTTGVKVGGSPPIAPPGPASLASVTKTLSEYYGSDKLAKHEAARVKAEGKKANLLASARTHGADNLDSARLADILKDAMPKVVAGASREMGEHIENLWMGAVDPSDIVEWAGGSKSWPAAADYQAAIDRVEASRDAVIASWKKAGGGQSGSGTGSAT